MEQVQIIVEKEMTSKIRKQFAIRTIIYSILYFAMIALFFIFGSVINSKVLSILLIVAVNVLFLMLLSKLAITDAFIGINTTSAPKKSLDRIANVTSLPLALFTCICSFLDIIYLHSIFDTSLGYSLEIIIAFASIIVFNLVVCFLIVNVYEKRILRKYLTIEEN